MRAIVRLVCAASALLVAACAAPAASPGASGQPAGSSARPAPTPAPRSAYDDPAWEPLIAAARQEGTLVLASGPDPNTRVKLPAAFKERFGVEIEYLAGRSSELQTRLRSERAAGVSSIDVIISGGDTAAGMYNDGWFQPMRPLLVVPAATNLAAFRNNRLPFKDPQDAYLFELESDVNGLWVVNPAIVADADLQTLDGLLAPRWTGKISVEDPNVPGQGQNNGVYLYVLKGEEFFRRLYVDQQPAVSRDDRQMQDWLARGQYPITFGLQPKDVDEMQQQGLPAKLIGLLDGPGFVVGGFGIMAVFDKPPHPNAAKLFVNWMATPEGMGLHASTEGGVPLRKDVERPWVKDVQVPKEGVAYLDLYDYRYIMEQKPAILRRMREIMGQ